VRALCREHIEAKRKLSFFLIISLFNYLSIQIENLEKKAVIINAEQKAWLNLFNFLLGFTW